MKKATLIETIAGIKTALPVSLELISDAKLLKTGNPYKDVVKVVTINGMIGMSYENGVNNALAREDKNMDFFVQEHPWMCRAENNLGKNKRKDDGKRYLPLKVQSASKPIYLHEGLDVTNKVAAWIPKKSAPKTQDGLEKKVIWRTPALSIIHKIRLLGAEHVIEG